MRERSTGGTAPRRAAAGRPQAAAGCPRLGAVPRPLGGTDLCGARPRAPGTPAATAAEGSGTPTACAPGGAGRLAWLSSAVDTAAGPSAPGSASAGSHSVVRVLQIRKLKHKEIKSLARGRLGG